VDAAGQLVDHPWIGTFTAESSAGITDLIAFTHPALLAFDELREKERVGEGISHRPYRKHLEEK
jgi:hypothetical protein